MTNPEQISLFFGRESRDLAIGIVVSANLLFFSAAEPIDLFVRLIFPHAQVEDQGIEQIGKVARVLQAPLLAALLHFAHIDGQRLGNIGFIWLIRTARA
jgi:hypothetical protein